MWFWLSLIALLCWSGSDLFSKIGCRDADDHLAHLKMVIAVGVVMGLHAAYEIFIGGVSVTWHVIWTYLPVSLLYIVSMALGYVGLRYIELSISSPICNASGAVVAVLYLCFGGLNAFLDELLAQTKEYAMKDYNTIGEYARSQGFEGEVMPWDMAYYSEKYRHEKYELNEELVKPYLQLDSVKRGVFLLANKLYGLNFTPNPEVPVYHPEVLREGGVPVGGGGR